MSAYEDLIKKVHEKANEFDCHLTKVKVANDALVRRSAEVLKGLTELFGTVREAQKCPVCYTREQKIALMPWARVLHIMQRPGPAEPLSHLPAARRESDARVSVKYLKRR